MSDLYLVLRHRLPPVTEWVTLGTETMRTAMKAQGLSHERAARQVPVVEKTWRRWVERGAVPVYQLPKVAKILRLEIEQPERVRIKLDENGEVEPLEPLTSEDREQLAASIHLFAELVPRFEQALGQLEALLPEQQEPQDVRTPVRDG